MHTIQQEVSESQAIDNTHINWNDKKNCIKIQVKPMLQYRNYNEGSRHNMPKLSLQRADKRLSFLSE